MLLTTDIGNSNIVLGLFRNSNLIAAFRLETTLSLTVDDFFSTVQDLIRTSGFQNREITDIIGASVVPQLTPIFKKMCEKKLNILPILVSSEMNLGFELKVKHPEEVGADRICNVAAVKQLYGSPAVVIDFGTATVYDVIDEGGNFIGGAIAPGIEISTFYLIKKAALLSTIDFKIPTTAIGTDTESNLQSGIVLGAVDQVEGMVRRIAEEKGWKDFPIIVTGGLGKLISGLSNLITHYDADLTLKGLQIVHDQTKRLATDP